MTMMTVEDEALNAAEELYGLLSESQAKEKKLNKQVKLLSKENEELRSHVESLEEALQYALERANILTAEMENMREQVVDDSLIRSNENTIIAKLTKKMERLQAKLDESERLRNLVEEDCEKFQYSLEHKDLTMESEIKRRTALFLQSLDCTLSAEQAQTIVTSESSRNFSDNTFEHYPIKDVQDRMISRRKSKSKTTKQESKPDSGRHVTFDEKVKQIVFEPNAQLSDDESSFESESKMNLDSDEERNEKPKKSSRKSKRSNEKREAAKVDSPTVHDSGSESERSEDILKGAWTFEGKTTSVSKHLEHSKMMLPRSKPIRIKPVDDRVAGAVIC